MINSDFTQSSFTLKDLGDQIKRWNELFPRIWGVNIPYINPPSSAESCLIIPKWEVLGATYSEAFRRLVTKLSEVYVNDFHLVCGIELNLFNIKQADRTSAALARIAQAQMGFDVLTVPISRGGFQLGCYSAKEARTMLSLGEFGLDAFTCAVMFLLHPEWLRDKGVMILSCIGDEWAPDVFHEDTCVPQFSIMSGGVCLSAANVNDASILSASPLGYSLSV
jgi:hypothetical protein